MQKSLKRSNIGLLKKSKRNKRNKRKNKVGGMNNNNRNLHLSKNSIFSNNSNNKITVSVRTPSDTRNIKVKLDKPIRSTIIKEFNLPNNIKLVFGGSEIQDTLTFEAYGVANGGVITVPEILNTITLNILYKTTPQDINITLHNVPSNTRILLSDLVNIQGWPGTRDLEYDDGNESQENFYNLHNNNNYQPYITTGVDDMNIEVFDIVDQGFVRANAAGTLEELSRIDELLHQEIENETERSVILDYNKKKTQNN